MKYAGLLCAALSTLPATAFAHSVNFKSPGPGMHFTQGMPLVVFADIFDSRAGKGAIVCPAGQTISNTQPPPAYSDPPRVAQCSGGGTPTGWPQFQVLVDGAVQVDLDSGLSRIPNTVAFNHDINPDPIGYFRFSAPTAGLAPGAHQIAVRAFFSIDGVNVTSQDGPVITVHVDAPPAKPTVTLSADLTGSVTWDNVIVVGNGHAVTGSGKLVIRNSLVSGLSRLGGSVTDATIEGSIFEDTGPLDLTVGTGSVAIRNNEWRANNRLKFEASNPSVPFVVTLRGSGANQKLFQGNRVGAGQLLFGGQGWLVGGDTDAESNVFIGPRTVLNVAASRTTVRGNYSHHNYRGAWSQGFNFYYVGAGADVLTEHNFIRDSSWPLQRLSGEFRYNVVYGYGHTWVRSMAANAVVHHNLFTPGGDRGLDAGVQCYGGEKGLRFYNNTFDGGGAALGDFANPTIDMSGGSQVASFRNNLVTFSRNVSGGGPGTVRLRGGSGAYLYADYNAFYSPDNSNKANYDFAGAGAHDATDAPGGQLAADPFAGARITTDSSRIIESAVDEAAIWQGTQKLSQVLALFRERYAPKAGSPVVDAGDPQDDDSSGRRSDIGAIDLDGHDQDRFGKFGSPPSETVPPTVSITAPAASASLSGVVTLSATAADNPGGSGVVLVEFLVDGSRVGQIAASPYAISFDTAFLANGAHAFSAKAWDAAGNFSVSAPVSATTANAGVPPGGGGTPPPGPTPVPGPSAGHVSAGCSASPPASPWSLAPIAGALWLAARRRRRGP